ncbi:MAG: hypothetical protein ACR2L2_06370 [Acidobacteriota bacterium]
MSALEQLRAAYRRVAERLDLDQLYAQRASDEYSSTEFALKSVAEEIVLAEKSASEEAIKELKFREQDLEAKRTRVSAEVSLWNAEPPERRAVIAYCTAFEIFLFDFLIAKIAERPTSLAECIEKRVGLAIRALKEDALDRANIEECIGRLCRSFHGLNDDVKRIYKECLGPMNLRSCSRAVIKDMNLLFQLRHDFVHNDGRAGTRYQANVGGYRDRVGIDKRPKEGTPMPGPVEILASCAVADKKVKKMEEFAKSLLCCAGWIEEFYASGASTTPPAATGQATSGMATTV